MLILSNYSQRGFNLIELTIGIGIVAILFALALPSFGLWTTNSRMRNWAESIQNGLQQARVEALKRNVTPPTSTVRFQLVDALTSTCVTSTSGTNWVISLDAIGLNCDKLPVSGLDATPPQVIQKATAENGATALVVVASDAVACFNGMGQIDRQTAGCSANAIVTYDISVANPTSVSEKTCAAIGGKARCLKVCAGNGSIKMCDPAVTDATDPRICAPAGRC